MPEEKTFKETLKLNLCEIQISRKSKTVNLVCRKLPEAMRGKIDFTAKDGFKVMSVSCPAISTSNIIYIQGSNSGRENAVTEFKTYDEARKWYNRAIAALKEWDMSTTVMTKPMSTKAPDVKKVNLLSAKILVKENKVTIICTTGEKFEKIRGNCFNKDQMFIASNGMPVLSSATMSLTSKNSINGQDKVCSRITDCVDTLWLPGCSNRSAASVEDSILFSDESTAQKWALRAKQAIEEWGVFMNKWLEEQNVKTYNVEV